MNIDPQTVWREVLRILRSTPEPHVTGVTVRELMRETGYTRRAIYGALGYLASEGMVIVLTGVIPSTRVRLTNN